MVDERDGEAPELLKLRRLEIQRVLGAATYYELLSIDGHATSQEIVRAYRRLVLLVHPDKTTEEGASAAFMRVQEAFMCLSNERARSQYNAALQQSGQSHDKCESDSDNNDIGTVITTEEFQRRMADKQAAVRAQVLLHLDFLDQLGVRMPPDDDRLDFEAYVEELAQSGQLTMAYNRWTLGATVALTVAGVVVPMSLPMFSAVVVLGPLVIGPALFWEEVLASFEDKTLTGKFLSSDVIGVTSSAASTSARLVLLWSLALAVTAINLPGAIVAYATTQLSKSASAEAFETWETFDVYHDGSVLFETTHVKSATTSTLDQDTSSNTSSSPSPTAENVVYTDDGDPAVASVNFSLLFLGREMNSSSAGIKAANNQPWLVVSYKEDPLSSLSNSEYDHLEDAPILP